MSTINAGVSNSLRRMRHAFYFHGISWKQLECIFIYLFIYKVYSLCHEPRFGNQTVIPPTNYERDRDEAEHCELALLMITN